VTDHQVIASITETGAMRAVMAHDAHHVTRRNVAGSRLWIAGFGTNESNEPAVVAVDLPAFSLVGGRGVTLAPATDYLRVWSVPAKP
jgi:hypothetical protein